MKKTVLFLVVLITQTALFANTISSSKSNNPPLTFTVDNITYSAISPTEVSVTGNIISTPSNIIIPSSVTDGGITYSVTSIGDNAFYQASLIGITLPNNLTSIGDYAFSYCTSLQSINIPNSVTSIGDVAFQGCSSLTSITIPDSVISLGLGTFSDSGLTSITLSNSITSIKQYEFYGCSGLTSITLPNSVINIGDYAFQNCSNLTSVDLQNSITSIGNYAFSYCASITSITLPNTVVSIGQSAFYGCSNLTSITLPNSVTSLGDNAFTFCTSLTSITIPTSVTNIGDSAFYGCSSLTSISIPNSVTSIGQSTFVNCTNLTSITLLGDVTSIGNQAFYQCSGVTSFTINAVTPPVISSNVFDNVTLGSVKLYVPAGSLIDYRNASVWSGFNFGSIITGPGPSTATTSSLSMNENSVPVTTFTADETVTWSLGASNDEALFSIDSASGALVFNAAPDYESPSGNLQNNTYIVEVIATATVSGLTTTQQLTVTITDVVEPAVLSNFNTITVSSLNPDFTINPPTSNSSGAFTYSSSDIGVATLNGTTVHIVGLGTTTITATQAADGSYLGNSITTTLTVSPDYITVTSTSDDGSAGTLRNAINFANSNSFITEIRFTPALTGTLTLTSDLPQILNDLTIVGPGANYFTISGDDLYAMFNIATSKTLTISGFTFTQNKSGSGTIFYAGNSNYISSSIVVTGNSNGSAFYSEGNSTITISNATFTTNGGNLFGSDYGSTPNTTSDTLTDYTNRITVTNSSFTGNTGTIFSTERYVKIDTCVFTANTQQIGYFRGVNRYQVLNSTFTNNTGYQLFSFYSWIGDGSNWGATTLGTNNTLFDGNTFTGNTGTIIEPGGSAVYWNKTTITNNIFINNGTSYTGSPIVVTNNTLDNFISSVTHSLVDSKLIVTMSRPVFNTNTGSGAIEVSDFELLLTGGNATLLSSTPSSISANGNVYTLGITLSGEISGYETITVKPIANSIYDATNNVAGTGQQNSTVSLNFLDADADGVSNFLDQCPNSLPGVRVYPTNGCEDTTYPFITYYNYGTTLNNPNSFATTTDHTLYFVDYDNNSNYYTLKKLSPEKVLSTVISGTSNVYFDLEAGSSNNLFVHKTTYNPNYSSEIINVASDGSTSVLYSTTNNSNTIEYFYNTKADFSNNLYIIKVNYNPYEYKIIKINSDGSTPVEIASTTIGYFDNLSSDNLGNVYYVSHDYNNSSEFKKIAPNGSISVLFTETYSYIYYARVDNLGTIYYTLYDYNNNSTNIKKITANGTLSQLYTLSNNSYIEDIALDAMNNFYFATNNSLTNQKIISIISPEGTIVSYSDYTGNSLNNDRSGTLYFNDYVSHKIMTSKLVQTLPQAVLSDFNSFTLSAGTSDFTINPPTSDSSGAITYTSSNPAVATIIGTTVHLVGPGTTTITATQAADGSHSGNSISATMRVSALCGDWGYSLTYPPTPN